MPTPPEALEAVLGPELFQLGLAATAELYRHWAGPDGAIEAYFTEGLARVLARTLNAGSEEGLSAVAGVLVSAMVLTPEHVARLVPYYAAGGGMDEPWMGVAFAEGGVSVKQAAADWSREWAARHGN